MEVHHISQQGYESLTFETMAIQIKKCVFKTMIRKIDMLD